MGSWLSVLALLLSIALPLAAPARAWTPSDAGDAEASAPAPAAKTSRLAIPEALEPWVPWVLEGGPGRQDQRACPIDPVTGERRCAWPGRLLLALDDSGGSFAQTWRLHARGWVHLPGDAETWPLAVAVDGRDWPVVQHDGGPALQLGAGLHRVTGRFIWARAPDALMIPPAVGLLDLTRDGAVVASPRLDRANRLWLRDPTASDGAREEDRLSLEVERRLQDSLPFEVLTRLRLEVSGGAREVALGPVLLEGGLPLRIESSLPARLESDGLLRVQVRPGRWLIELASQHPGAVRELARPASTAPWPEHEVWAFAAEPQLRRVELSGLVAIDPRQTSIPEGWMRWPVYRVGPKDRLSLSEQARGDPDPGPDRLRLERHLWLDFDGGGYSVQDRIVGQRSRGWRLDASPALDLGQVRVDGQPVLITRLDASAPPGVEVRRGELNVVADARLDAPPGQLPASGWAPELESVRALLELPPGWDLLAVRGVDNLPSTWVGRWSLLDLFLVLILALGIGRLWGWGWGLLALVTLGSIWHAPGAPRLVWLHLLAAAALLRLIPPSVARTAMQRARMLILIYFRLSLLTLLVIGLPFLVDQVRTGLFPHLERPWVALGELGGAGLPMTAAPGLARVAPSDEVYAVREKVADALQESAGAPPEPIEVIDPQARLQTGLGIPDWGWSRFDLVWSGPVGTDETARLWLLTPGWHLVWSLTGAVLLVLLGLRLAGVLEPRRGSAASLGLAVVLLVGAGVGSAPASAEALPSPELLGELRARLLAPPECLPHCAELASLNLTADAERLVLELTLDAAEAVAAPLPGGLGGWLPSEVRIDGVAAESLRRDETGGLVLALPAGRHRVELAGALGARDQVEIALPMPPRHARIEVEGWTLEGVDRDGRPGAQIRLVRLAETATAPEETLAQGALPPLVRVERTLRLGVEWRVETRARRLSPSDFPILIPVPLLPGEAVQTPGVRVEAGRALVDLPAGRAELGWSSRLDPVSSLRLVAADDPRLSEDWRLDVGPLWHLEHAGLAPIHRLGPAERWLPTWRPLPGESLTLTLTRPAAVPGPTLTLDRVDLRVEPGQRGTRATLALAIRASQGGAHRLRLPDGSEPLELKLDGRSLPLPSTAPEIELPLTPGSTRAEVTWRTPDPLGLLHTPAAPDLGTPAVNLNLALALPADRWVLWAWGPRMGPAVLFWGLLLILIGVSLGLGRSRLTPLRVHDWLLLGMGLLLAEVWVALVVVGWLFALGWRARLDPLASPPWRFNLIQSALVILTLLALAGLVGAVQQGLLGPPEMQIMGNGSSATELLWYQDRGGPGVPSVGVLSVPMWVYRALMLAWALWLAMRLLDWLRWGWASLSKPVLWRETSLAKGERRDARSSATPASAPDGEAASAVLRLDL